MSKLIFRSDVDPRKVYVTIGATRFVFEEGKYIGKFKCK